MTDKYDKVLVLGIGGGAGRIVHGLAERKLGDWLHVAVMDSDVHDLDFADGVLQIPLGEDWTKGIGCGGDMLEGEHVTAKRVEEIRELLCDAELTIFVTCLGGGVGSGGIQILHRLLREEECLGMSVAVMPFEFEGNDKKRRADLALEALRRHDDVVVVLNNDVVSAQLPANAPFAQAIDMANDRIVEAIVGLASIIRRRDGIPIEVAALHKLFNERPAACTVGVGQGRVADGVGAIVDKTFRDPLLGGLDFVQRSHVVVIAMTGGPDVPLSALQSCAKDVCGRLRPSTRTLTAACPLPEQEEGTLRLLLLAIQYDRPADQIPRDELNALDYGDLTMRLSPGESYLPVSTNDVSGILGVFGNSSPTVHKGENLDMPTFVRRGVTIQQIVESIYEIAED